MKLEFEPDRSEDSQLVCAQCSGQINGLDFIFRRLIA